MACFWFIVDNMNISAQTIINAIDLLPDEPNWSSIVIDLLEKKGVTMSTLATFTNTSITGIGRLKSGDNPEPKSNAGLRLLRLHATLCADKYDD